MEQRRLGDTIYSNVYINYPAGFVFSMAGFESRLGCLVVDLLFPIFVFVVLFSLTVSLCFLFPELCFFNHRLITPGLYI